MSVCTGYLVQAAQKIGFRQRDRLAESSRLDDQNPTPQKQIPQTRYLAPVRRNPKVGGSQCDGSVPVNNLFVTRGSLSWWWCVISPEPASEPTKERKGVCTEEPGL